MQSHGGNTSLCDYIARFLPWVQLEYNIVRHPYFAFFSAAAMIFTPSPSNLIDSIPPRMRPFPQRPSARAGGL